MKKRKQPVKPPSYEEKQTTTLGDLFGKELARKRATLADEADKKAEAERVAKIEAKKQAEKNKTFEQLFAESNQDWRTFK